MKVKSFYKIAILVSIFAMLIAILYLNIRQNYIERVATTVNIKNTTKLEALNLPKNPLDVKAGTWSIPIIDGQQAFCIGPGEPVHFKTGITAGKTYYDALADDGAIDEKCSDCDLSFKRDHDDYTVGPFYEKTGEGVFNDALAYVFGMEGASWEDQQQTLWAAGKEGLTGDLKVGTGHTRHNNTEFQDFVDKYGGYETGRK